MATVSNAIVKAHYRQAHLRGYVRPEQLREAGLNADDIITGEGRSPADAFGAWLAALWRENNDESGGFLPTPVKNGTFAMGMHAVISAGNLRRALLRSGQYYRLISDHLRIDLREQGEEAHLILHIETAPTEDNRVFYDALLVLWLRWCSWIIDQPLLLERVNVPYALPAYADEYFYMYHCPVYTDQQDCRLVFNRSYLDRPLIRTPLDLPEFLSGAPGNLLVHFQQRETLSAAVFDLFAECPETLSDQALTGEKLSVSGATLRRQLKAEGVTFQQLKDQWRRKQAFHLLRHSAISLPEISAQLGFSEPSAFSRAFKKWTGQKPTDFRI